MTPEDRRDADRDDDPAAAARVCAEPVSAGEGIVESVGLDVAHDSDALLIVTLRFPNGGGRIPLAGPAVARVLERLGLADVGELVGRPFSVAPALPVNAGD
ncbi:MAG: hypothetical protein R3E53_18600 [Myxococcota bacterium]